MGSIAGSDSVSTWTSRFARTTVSNAGSGSPRIVPRRLYFRNLLIVPQVVQRDVQQQLMRIDRAEERIRRRVRLERRFGLLRERQRAGALLLEPRHHLRARQVAVWTNFLRRIHLRRPVRQRPLEQIGLADRRRPLVVDGSGDALCGRREQAGLREDEM